MKVDYANIQINLSSPIRDVDEKSLVREFTEQFKKFLKTAKAAGSSDVSISLSSSVHNDNNDWN